MNTSQVHATEIPLSLDGTTTTATATAPIASNTFFSTMSTALFDSPLNLLPPHRLQHLLLLRPLLLNLLISYRKHMPGVHLLLAQRGTSGGAGGGRRGAPSLPAPPPPPPKGWMAVRVGGEGEEQQRFLVPVGYLNHPLFVALLRAAEEEYGFHHTGAITIPCHVEHFRRVQGIIDGDAPDGHRYHFHRCFRA